MKRNKHNLTSYNLLTCDMGELVPINVTEVLPGDSIQARTSVFLRCSPMLAPIMHPVICRVHHWFVPFRILWDEWEDFITGGPDGNNASVFPTITTTVNQGDPLDYMGIPPGTSSPVTVSAMPIRAMNMIFNEWYRDQDIVPERGLEDLDMPRIAWEKDYFCASRPWPQKGPEVLLPLGQEALVKRSPNAPVWKGYVAGSETPSSVNPVTFQAGAVLQEGTNQTSLDPNGGLYADLANATAASITDLRTALAIQRYQEARARYGSRYTEYLRYLGVRSSDARLQRPEFLGGGKSTIAFSEVLQTYTGDPAGAGPLGKMGGHGIMGMRSNRFRRFFEEHGVVLTMLSVRPKTMYTQGIHRSWLRRSKEDFWQRELEHIGQQEVFSKEVYADAVQGTFGYHDRYHEYRQNPSRISSEFRDILDFWHLGREFSAEPVLNESFVECAPSKRIFAEQTQDSLWIMANNQMVARRLVSRNAAPRIY